MAKALGVTDSYYDADLAQARGGLDKEALVDLLMSERSEDDYEEGDVSACVVKLALRLTRELTNRID